MLRHIAGFQQDVLAVFVLHKHELTRSKVVHAQEIIACHIVRESKHQTCARIRRAGHDKLSTPLADATIGDIAKRIVFGCDKSAVRQRVRTADFDFRLDDWFRRSVLLVASNKSYHSN